MQTNLHTNNSSKSDTPAPFKGCPLVSSPYPECYSNNLNSYNIIRITQYCIGNYKLCEIYCNKVEGKNK